MLSQLRASRAATAPPPWSAPHRLARPLQTPPAAWLDPRRAAAEQQKAPARDAPAASAAPPPTKLLEQTAQHLIELNKRRAELEEQNAVLLREKHELSTRLARAEAELAKAAEELSRAKAAAPAMVAAEAAPTPTTPAETAPAEAPPPAFTIEYHSGWPRAFAHYCPRGGNWTSAPGKAMQRQPRSDDGARHVFVLELEDAGDALEFALTDGAGEWDNGGGSNYRVEGRGFSWRVRSGRVERI